MASPRSPAQIEAARRNGALSRGPVTPEGKARCSQNALRHGLAAATHLLLPDEDKAAYEALLAELVAEIEPETPQESRLVQRLAACTWKQARADRLEQEVLAAGAAFEVARFNAVRLYQAGLSREADRIARELRRLRAERALPNEPETTVAETGNEPEPSPARLAARPAKPWNEPGTLAAPPKSRNEPEPTPARPALNRQQRRRLEALRRAAA